MYPRSTFRIFFGVADLRPATSGEETPNMLGKLLAAPVRIANAPVRAMEKVVDSEDREEDRIASRPLEAVAESLEEAVDGESKDRKA